MNPKIPNRIAAEDISDLVTWSPPQVGSANASAAKTVRATAEKNKRQADGKRPAGQARQRDSEIIEDVAEGEVNYSPITAEELQAITEAAEKEGLEKGYQEGFSKGEADGKRIAQEKAEAEAQQQLGMQVSHLLQVAEVLVEPIAGQEKALENMLLDFVCGLTRQLVEREMLQDSSQVLQAVQTAIEALPSGASNIKICLNPDDLALIETYAEEHQKDWVFRADPGLMAGGCRIETRESLVDYSMEHRLDELLRQFRDKQLSAGSSQQSDPTGEPATEVAPEAESVAASEDAAPAGGDVDALAVAGDPSVASDPSAASESGL